RAGARTGTGHRKADRSPVVGAARAGARTETARPTAAPVAVRATVPRGDPPGRKGSSGSRSCFSLAPLLWGRLLCYRAVPTTAEDRGRRLRAGKVRAAAEEILRSIRMRAGHEVDEFFDPPQQSGFQISIGTNRAEDPVPRLTGLQRPTQRAHD